ncbi:hypothetical protein EAF04_002477 [Stromatinia cepivora]|nr:hypothetical protein EAF04_002477 [Stromatinia cepivora]
MKYHFKPNNRAGIARPMLPLTYDININPREVFLLDGVTPASIQERLDEVMADTRRRKEADRRDHQNNFIQSHGPGQDDQYWQPQQEHPNSPNFDSMPQPSMHTPIPFNNGPLHGVHIAMPAVPFGEGTGYMQMLQQPLNSETFTTHIPFGKGPKYMSMSPQFVNPEQRQFQHPPFQDEQRHAGGQMWNQNDSAAISQHRRRQIGPPPNYFTRSVTVTEAYSTNPPDGSSHNTHQHNASNTYAPHHPKNTMPQQNRPQVPHTVTEMNEELNMPHESEPYADQFQMAPSKRLQRRKGSFIPDEDESQTSSGNYKGNPRAGVRGLPDHLNCALWLKNLPADIQAHEVFEQIHTGAVSAFEITRPQGIYVMCAAKLVFKHPEAATRFKNQCESVRGIYIRRRRIKVCYNTFGHRRYRNKQKTRILCIEGPSEYVIYDDLKLYFESFCDHELSDWDFAPSRIPGHRKLILGFARIEGQARQCLEGLRAHPVYGKYLTVEYAPDPCGALYP